jgi:hypothetical protein
MATRKVSNRYPRRGERIAPQTLREFLAEPVPEHLLDSADGASTGGAALKLCDLDETAWQRFSEAALVELARRIVDCVAAHHVRKVFQDRHFPRPPQGTCLEDLSLENRTRRCLVREGFEDNPQLLGEHSLGEIMSLRAFGPRCLVDLLSALESSHGGKNGSRDRAEQPSALSAKLTAAARRLAQLPEAAQARKEDPRFSKCIESVGIEAASAGELAERLLCRTQDPPDPVYVTQQVQALADQLEEVPHLTLEAELVQIFGSTPYPRNRDILVGYYGWEDGGQHTLTEIGKRFGITRERVRQVCAKLTRKRKNLPAVFAPVMDRTLAMIEKQLPCSAQAIEAQLAEQKLTAVGMPLEAVVTAARLLERPVRFSLVGVDAARLAVRPEQAEAVATIVDLAKKEIYFHGLSTVERVQQLVSTKSSVHVGSSVHVAAELVAQTLPLLKGFCWLDQRSGWFRLLPISKHGLPKTIDKILAVADGITVSQMRAAIGRNRRLWKDPPPENVLLEFCRQTSRVRVEGNRIVSDPPRNWKKSLTGVEARLVGILKSHGPVMDRSALEDLCVAAGMNRFSFHAFISWSPVITQLGHSVYGLLGTRAPKREVESLLAGRRAKRCSHRVLDGHGRTQDGKVWLSYRLSKAASTYAVITVPAALKGVVRGRFALIGPDGSPIGTLAAKDGRAWGLGAFLRHHGAQINDRIVLTLDLDEHIATVCWAEKPPLDANITTIAGR